MNLDLIQPDIHIASSSLWGRKIVVCRSGVSGGGFCFILFYFFVVTASVRGDLSSVKHEPIWLFSSTGDRSPRKTDKTSQLGNRDLVLISFSNLTGLVPMTAVTYHHKRGCWAQHTCIPLWSGRSGSESSCSVLTSRCHQRGWFFLWALASNLFPWLFQLLEDPVFLGLWPLPAG